VDGFRRAVVTISAGQVYPFRAAEWADMIILVECGTVELELCSGERRELGPGAIFWLAGLPMLALRNAGREPVVLMTISRPERETIS